MHDAELLRDARERTGLTIEQAAELLATERSELASVEAGERFAPPSLLDAYARVWPDSHGVHARADGRNCILSALSFPSRRGAELQRTCWLRRALTLGDFLRCVRGVAEMRTLLGETRGRSTLDAVAAPEAPREIDLLPRAEVLAMKVRERLNLGVAPIASMKAVFDQLDIDVFWITPDELDVEIGAGSTVSPSPASLVNLVGGAEQW